MSIFVEIDTAPLVPEELIQYTYGWGRGRGCLSSEACRILSK